MKKYFDGLIIAFLLFLTVVYLSCSKMDSYKKFSDGQEIVYPGIFDSLKVISGRNRALITGILESDPKVTSYKVFWNDGLDSLEGSLIRTGGVDTLRQIVENLPEGPITFEIRTYDDMGNKSIPMSVIGDVYGTNFQNSIDQRGNRSILQSTLSLDGAVSLIWADVESYVGIVGMSMHYYDVNGILHDTIIPVQLQDQVTELPKVDIQKPITYNTLFIPNGIGIDTLMVMSTEAPKVTEVQLLNNIVPVTNMANDGSRWATLSNWISNDAIKNHDGYGGADLDGHIYFSAGWGAPSIVNGKIYQKVMLPAGKYTFEGVSNYNYYVPQEDDGVTVDLVVAEGGDGLPDKDNLSSTLGYQSASQGATDVTFELKAPTTVSVGCLVNLPDWGRELQFSSLRLYIVD